MAGKKRGESENSPSRPTGLNHSDRSDGPRLEAGGAGPSPRLPPASSQPNPTEPRVRRARFCGRGEARRSCGGLRQWLPRHLTLTENTRRIAKHSPRIAVFSPRQPPRMPVKTGDETEARQHRQILTKPRWGSAPGPAFAPKQCVLPLSSPGPQGLDQARSFSKAQVPRVCRRASSSSDFGVEPQPPIR